MDVRAMARHVRSSSSSAIRCAVLGVLILAAQACAGRIHPAPSPTSPLPAGASPQNPQIPAPSAQNRSTPVSRSDQPMMFLATAYCRGTTTAVGTTVVEGIVAADPALLPIGT